MTKTEAIKILQPFRDAMVDQHGCPISDAVYALDVAIETLKQPEQQWIPVTATELLPLSEDEVIVSIRDEMIDGSKFNYTSHGWLTTNKEYWIVDNEINNNVVAWMPWPKPWKGTEMGMREVMERYDDYAVDIVDNAPTAEVVERKKGRWVKITGMMPPEYHGHYECSECGWHLSHHDKTKENELGFCPNCGSYNGGNEDVDECT